MAGTKRPQGEVAIPPGEELPAPAEESSHCGVCRRNSKEVKKKIQLKKVYIFLIRKIYVCFMGADFL
jgi:hypothetical protein